MTVIKSTVVNTGSSNYRFRNLCFIRQLLITAGDFSICSQQQQHGPGPEWSQAGNVRRKKKQTDQKVSKKSKSTAQQPPSRAEPNESSFALVIICHCLGERERDSRFWQRMQNNDLLHPPASSLYPLLPHYPPPSRYFLWNLHINNTCTINSATASERICLSVLF